MSKLPFTNPSQARRVWDSMAHPSSRRVARKMSQSGRPVSHETINRWRRQRWRPLEHEAQHPIEAARELLDDALPLLTGDPMTTAKSLIEESAEREALEQLTDGELLRRAAREVAIAVCLVAKGMVVKARLAATKPTEFGVLMRALAQCLQAATAASVSRPAPDEGAQPGG
jgi:hypothetical protein